MQTTRFLGRLTTIARRDNISAGETKPRQNDGACIAVCGASATAPQS
ncbi:MAG: hypothetical protein ABJ357_11215 [Parasphingorhabdus sp.]